MPSFSKDCLNTSFSFQKASTSCSVCGNENASLLFFVSDTLFSKNFQNFRLVSKSWKNAVETNRVDQFNPPDENIFEKLALKHENQNTLEGNALEKAKFIFEKYAYDCFSEDTFWL